MVKYDISISMLSTVDCKNSNLCKLCYAMMLQRHYIHSNNILFVLNRVSLNNSSVSKFHYTMTL